MMDSWLPQWPIAIFFDTNSRWHWLFVLSSLLVAVGVVLGRRLWRKESLSLRATLTAIFPRELYTHRSARIDYLYAVINVTFFAALVGSMSFGSSAMSNSVRVWCAAIHLPQFDVAPAVAVFFFSLVIALALDFGLYLAHLLMHKVPMLWDFHKVHHSAEVLTPVTALRVHPVEDGIAILFSGVFAAVVGGVFQHVLSSPLQLFTLGGLHIVLFAFYFLGFHLRHSHIWLSYGSFFSRLIISPAQHQIHHSVERRHWDKNMGFMFALWDWLFGTLYVPQEREDFRLGIPEKNFSSVGELYLRPFQDAWRRFHD